MKTYKSHKIVQAVKCSEIRYCDLKDHLIADAFEAGYTEINQQSQLAT